MEENINIPQRECRVCLANSNNVQSIHAPDEKSGLSLFLSEMIMSFTSAQVILGDGLPEEICETCAENTVKMYLFKLKCEESDRILRERVVVKGRSDEAREVRDDENKIFIEDYNLVMKSEEIVIDTAKSDDADESFVTDFHADTNSDSDIDKTELPKIEFKCAQCSQIFDSHVALTHHASSHNVKAFKCETCNKQFSRNDLLLRHNIAHAIKMADQEFDVGNEAKEIDDDTIIIKTEDSFYACKECNFVFIKKDELKSHLLSHNKNVPKVVCQICQKRFTKQAHLNRHLRVHNQDRPYECSTCKKRFVKQEQLNNHMNVHSRVKSHVCKICFKGFNQISNLKDHMRTHNGEKPFLCSTCGKGFNQLGNLRQHTIRHSGIKAHLCSTCGSGFASKGELSAHLRKHTGARPFVCPVCGHGFTTSSSLTKHKRIHSGEKPYECDVCKMRFSRSGILARHKRTHTGEKPYVCKFCSRAFSQSNDLTSHLRIHTGEKPFICDECGQAFRQSSALKTHKKTHITNNEKKPLVDSHILMDIKPPSFFGNLPYA